MMKVRLVRARGAGPDRPARSGAAAACSARSRNTSSRGWSPATPSSSPARWCASRAGRDRGLRLARQRQADAKMPVLHGRQVSAVDLSGRRRARHCSPTSAHWNALARAGARLAALQARSARVPGAARTAGRDLSARHKHYLVCYPLRGAAGAPDARHAADAAAGARAGCGRSASSPPTMRWPSGAWATFVDDPQASSISTSCSTRTCWATISRLAARKHADEAHLPQLRGDLRPDRAALPGEEKTGRQVTVLDRPDLRRAAQARARSRAAARRARPMPRPGCSIFAGSVRCSRGSGANRPQGTRPDFAARGAGDAGNRPRSGLWRSLRRVAGGSRRGTGQGSDVVS